MIGGSVDGGHTILLFGETVMDAGEHNEDIL